MPHHYVLLSSLSVSVIFVRPIIHIIFHRFPHLILRLTSICHHRSNYDVSILNILVR